MSPQAGFKHSAETREKMRASQRRRTENPELMLKYRSSLAVAALSRGKNGWTEAQHAKWSENMRAIWANPEYRAAMSSARRKRGAYDPDDFSTWTGKDKREFKKGRNCEWPGGCTHPTRFLYVDHDHATGRVRGVLCTVHNLRILGNYEKHRAACEEYLGRFLENEDVALCLPEFLEAAQSVKW